MLWNKVSLKSSLHSLLGQGAGKQDRARTQRLEHIRAAMLECLAASDVPGFEHVQRRIGEAKDVEALWYLRADLMAVVARNGGESAARRRMHGITDLFDGVLPPGLNARRTTLGD